MIEQAMIFHSTVVLCLQM